MPTPLLVTTPPTQINSSVEAAVNSAKRVNPGLSADANMIQPEKPRLEGKSKPLRLAGPQRFERQPLKLLLIRNVSPPPQARSGLGCRHAAYLISKEKSAFAPSPVTSISFSSVPA